MLQANVTVVCDGTTLADVRKFVAHLDQFEVPGSALLLDGGHTALADDPSKSVGGSERDVTVDAVRRFVAELAERPGGVVCLHADALAVELDVVAVDTIECADHVRDYPVNVLVAVQERCAQHR